MWVSRTAPGCEWCSIAAPGVSGRWATARRTGFLARSCGAGRPLVPRAPGTGHRAARVRASTGEPAGEPRSDRPMTSRPARVERASSSSGRTVLDHHRLDRHTGMHAPLRGQGQLQLGAGVALGPVPLGDPVRPLQPEVDRRVVPRTDGDQPDPPVSGLEEGECDSVLARPRSHSHQHRRRSRPGRRSCRSPDDILVGRSLGERAHQVGRGDEAAAVDDQRGVDLAARTTAAVSARRAMTDGTGTGRASGPTRIGPPSATARTRSVSPTTPRQCDPSRTGRWRTFSGAISRNATRSGASGVMATRCAVITEVTGGSSSTTSAGAAGRSRRMFMHLVPFLVLSRFSSQVLRGRRG